MKKLGIGGHQSHDFGKDEWLTPPEIVKAAGPFDLDPCSPLDRPLDTAARHISIVDDGLNSEWTGRVWCNPPYGRETGKWLKKCADHGNATALIFARTETADWVNNVWSRAHAILFIFGRLYFHHSDGRRADVNSGAPSALISYDEQNTMALEQSGIAGRVIRLR